MNDAEPVPNGFCTIWYEYKNNSKLSSRL